MWKESLPPVIKSRLSKHSSALPYLNLVSYGDFATNLDYVLVSPHSSDGSAAFWQICKSLKDTKNWPSYETYLAVEKDSGAWDLTLALANQLQSLGYQVLCIELAYPRGLLDGGRLLEHALRPVLDPEMSELLGPQLLQIHQLVLSFVSTIYHLINEQKARLIDIHSMASFDAQLANFTLDHENIEEYVAAYVNEQDSQRQRGIDLIYRDASGKIIGSEALATSVRETYAAQNIVVAENEPYCAEKAYLMYQHMKNCPAIAIDYPKHEFVSNRSLENLNLKKVQIDKKAITFHAKILAQALDTII